MKIPMLLAAVVVALVACVVACALALRLFPWFRSGERKEGHFRPDQSTGSFRIDTRKDVPTLRAGTDNSNELPLVGGVAMILAITAAGIATGVMLNLTLDQWELLAVLLVAMVGFGAVGFLDDWRKVHKGEGISEIQKFAGVVVVSMAAGAALNRLIAVPAFPRTLSARVAYPPYSDIPVLGDLLVHQHFAWIIFFILMTVTVSSSTALAVDFSDGMDGLCGGLLLSAGLSFAAILLGEGADALTPAAIAMLAIVGAAAGFLPFNWPSSWKARNQGRGRRRAVLIMGDTGSLALGGLLALVAVISRLEFVLIFIGGVFVLEGVSALVSARILVRFFRRFLVLERFGSSRGFVHTELPLPFLATPMHHHFDLLGWDRKRLVYGAWLLGAGLGVLGVASVIGTFTWERYLARFVALLLILVVWQSGPWTRSYFIGLSRVRGSRPDAPRRLTLFYGFPFKLFGQPLYSQVQVTGVTEEALASPAEKLSLWQRLSVFDARSMLGYYCYRAGNLEDARRIWRMIPRSNLEKRPEIANLLAEVTTILAEEADGVASGQEGSMTGRVDSVSESSARGAEPQATPSPEDPSASAWRMPIPTGMRPYSPHLEPTEADAIAPEPPAETQITAPLWNAGTWAAAMSGEPPSADTARQDETGDSGEPGEPERQIAEPAKEVSGAKNPKPYTHL